MTSNQAAKRLSLLDQENIVAAPEAADPLTARLINEAGFRAVYASGAGVAAIRLEDQVTSRHCGHFSGKQVLPAGKFGDGSR